MPFVVVCRKSDDFANQICLNESRSKMRAFSEKTLGTLLTAILKSCIISAQDTQYIKEQKFGAMQCT